jgi:hypothetical protein
MKKITTFAIAAAAMLGAASLASAPASAGFKGGFHKHWGGHHHHHWGWKHHWGYGVHAIPHYYGGCFWKHKPWGLVKVCY